MKALVAALCLIAAPVAAQTPDAARAQGELIAQAIDANSDSVIAPDEMAAYGTIVFDTLDIDADGILLRDETAAFRFGMTEIAEFRGRKQAYDTAQSIVFDIFDRDNDGEVTRNEHEHGFRRAFRFADLDEDGLLTMREYLEGFILNIAMRAALSD